MIIANKGELELFKVMNRNIDIVLNHCQLNSEMIAGILHSSFWNYRLRFIFIDGEMFPTNSKMHIRGGIFLRYSNPHEKDVRVSYDEKSKLLFFEKQEWVPHPFTSMQRIPRDTAILCDFFGYEKFGYTDPNETVSDWKKFGNEIPVSEITAMNIEAFWDRPRMIWNENDDYTAYKIIISTKKQMKEKPNAME